MKVGSEPRQPWLEPIWHRCPIFPPGRSLDKRSRVGTESTGVLPDHMLLAALSPYNPDGALRLTVPHALSEFYGAGKEARGTKQH